jgi:hypothetical protein
MISSNPELLIRVADIYHRDDQANSCTAENCPGAIACTYASGLDLHALNMVVKAVEAHVSHIYHDAFQQLKT